jgi:hypothetical protein
MFGLFYSTAGRGHERFHDAIMWSDYRQMDRISLEIALPEDGRVTRPRIVIGHEEDQVPR